MVRGDTTEQPHVPKKDSSVKKPVDRTQDKSNNVRVTINKSSKTTKPKSAAEGHMSAGLHEKGRPEKKKSSLSKKNVSPVKNFVDCLMFFGDFVPSFETFQEVEDESEERRNARFKQHMKTQERMVTSQKAISLCDDCQLDSLLKYAAKNGNSYCISALIEAGADVNRRD